jgi:hypothetical protein
VQDSFRQQLRSTEAHQLSASFQLVSETPYNWPIFVPCVVQHISQTSGINFSTYYIWARYKLMPFLYYSVNAINRFIRQMAPKRITTSGTKIPTCRKPGKVSCLIGLSTGFLIFPLILLIFMNASFCFAPIMPYPPILAQESSFALHCLVEQASQNNL